MWPMFFRPQRVPGLSYAPSMDCGVAAPLWLASLALGITLSGCGRDEFPVRDEQGRECVRLCDGDDCELDCGEEVLPVGLCPGPNSKACFKLGFTSDGLWGLCDSCCYGEAWVLKDCTALVCDEDRDCASADVHCSGGHCVQ